jgi:hypothetical protein
VTRFRSGHWPGVGMGTNTEQIQNKYSNLTEVRSVSDATGEIRAMLAQRADK